jgi:hypothetical protein
MCIFDLLEMISIQVITSGTDSGGSGFICSWHKGVSMSSFQQLWWK